MSAVNPTLTPKARGTEGPGTEDRRTTAQATTNLNGGALSGPYRPTLGSKARATAAANRPSTSSSPATPQFPPLRRIAYNNAALETLPESVNEEGLPGLAAIELLRKLSATSSKQRHYAVASDAASCPHGLYCLSLQPLAYFGTDGPTRSQQSYAILSAEGVTMCFYVSAPASPLHPPIFEDEIVGAAAFERQWRIYSKLRQMTLFRKFPALRIVKQWHSYCRTHHWTSTKNRVQSLVLSTPTLLGEGHDHMQKFRQCVAEHEQLLLGCADVAAHVPSDGENDAAGFSLETWSLSAASCLAEAHRIAAKLAKALEATREACMAADQLFLQSAMEQKLQEQLATGQQRYKSAVHASVLKRIETKVDQLAPSHRGKARLALEEERQILAASILRGTQAHLDEAARLAAVMARNSLIQTVTTVVKSTAALVDFAANSKHSQQLQLTLLLNPSPRGLLGLPRGAEDEHPRASWLCLAPDASGLRQFLSAVCEPWLDFAEASFDLVCRALSSQWGGKTATAPAVSAAAHPAGSKWVAHSLATLLPPELQRGDAALRQADRPVTPRRTRQPLAEARPKVEHRSVPPPASDGDSQAKSTALQALDSPSALILGDYQYQRLHQTYAEAARGLMAAAHQQLLSLQSISTLAQQLREMDIWLQSAVLDSEPAIVTALEQADHIQQRIEEAPSVVNGVGCLILAQQAKCELGHYQRYCLDIVQAALVVLCQAKVLALSSAAKAALARFEQPPDAVADAMPFLSDVVVAERLQEQHADDFHACVRMYGICRRRGLQLCAEAEAAMQCLPFDYRAMHNQITTLSFQKSSYVAKFLTLLRQDLHPLRMELALLRVKVFSPALMAGDAAAGEVAQQRVAELEAQVDQRHESLLVFSLREEYLLAGAAVPLEEFQAQQQQQQEEPTASLSAAEYRDCHTDDCLQEIVQLRAHLAILRARLR